MATPRKYFHDRLVLLLLTLNSFLVLLTAVSVFLRLDSVKTGHYIAQYRANVGIIYFKNGDVLDLIAFPVFSALIFGLGLFISHKIYPSRRSMAITALSLSLLLLILSLIVSNALLVLQ